MQDGTEVRVCYTLIARDTVLAEEFRPKDVPVMITMFSVDGDRLLATHYCSAMNQPQMSTAAITDPDTKVLSFSLVRVTGLKSSPEDWHNTGLIMKLEGDDRLTREWTYRHKGTEGKNRFQLTRAR